MSTFLEIVTALGTVVAAFSIIFAFALYKIQKRDEYISAVRKSLQILSSNMEELDSLLNFELAYELCSSLVYSASTQYCLQNIYLVCNEFVGSDKSEEEIKKSIKDILGLFGTSFQTELAKKYNDLIAEITQSSTIFYPDYKGLFRFSKACTTMMRNVFSNYKKILLSGDILTKIIYKELIPSDGPWDSYDHFQKKFLDSLISIVELGRIKRSQKDVDCLLELVEIVYSSHIELSAKEWRNLGEKSRKIALQPYNTVTTVTGDLRESEKCFCNILSHDAVTKYVSLVQTIEIANSEDT